MRPSSRVFSTLLLVSILTMTLGVEDDWRQHDPLRIQGSSTQAQVLSLKSLQPGPLMLARMDTQPIHQQVIDYKNFYFWMNYIVVTTIGLGIAGVIL